MPESKTLRFILIEVLIFAVAALLSTIMRWDFGVILAAAGVLLLVSRFGSAGGLNNSTRGLGSYTVERQVLHDATDPALRRERGGITSDLFIIALPPLIIGIILMFIPKG